MRWEVVPPPTEASGNDPAVVNQIDTPSTMSLLPPGAPLWKTTYNNFAPRFGLAYRLSQSAKAETVLRGGIGLFFDLGDGQATNAFALAFPFTARKVLINRPLPLSSVDAAAPVAGPAPTAADFIYAFDPNLKLPRVYQWNLAIEQSFGNQTVTGSYVAAIGRRLIRLEERVNVNPNLLGSIEISKNDAASDYHAFQLQYRRQLTRGFQALASYTLAKSIDNISSDAFNTPPAEITNQQQERGPSSFDVRHSFNAALTYELPRPDFDNPWKSIVGNWAIDGIFTARSAPAVNVTYLVSIPNGILILRPDLVENQPLFLDDPLAGGGRRLNPAAFSIPTSLRQGGLGRNALRGFRLAQLDFGVRREFGLSERTKLQLKIEIFNLFNHPNFGNPAANLGSLSGTTFFADPLFGRSNSMLGRSLGTGGSNGGFNPLYQVGGPRSMQLSLKLLF